jgi:hypothetical protein
MQFLRLKIKKVHYNALFGDGKGRKSGSTQRRRGAEKGFEGEQVEKRREMTPGDLKVALTFFSAKSFISTHIDYRSL